MKPTHGTTPHSPQNLVALTEQKQDLASSRQALQELYDVDVIPVHQLIEAVYGKVADIDTIRAKLEREQSLSSRGWKAFHNSAKDSYHPSDSPFEEEKAFANLATIF